MNNQRPLEIVLSPRLGEMLDRLAARHRRTREQEAAYIIEAVATGQYQDHGDFRITAPISLSDLPPPLIEKVSARLVRGQEHP